MREQLVPHEELAAASAEKLAAEKQEEAMNEAYRRVGTDVTRDVRLVAVLDIPSAAAAMVVVPRASVWLAVRFH
jgi:hypothetical protein